MAIRYRRYVAAIIFIRSRAGPRFLLLHRIQNWRGWEYVKGGLLPKESLMRALKREILEETGARRFRIIAKLPFKIKYSWPKQFVKDRKRWQGASQRVFLVEVFSRKIKLDRKEHSRYKWVAPKNASRLLTYKEARITLRYVLDKVLSGARD